MNTVRTLTKKDTMSSTAFSTYLACTACAAKSTDLSCAKFT